MLGETFFLFVGLHYPPMSKIGISKKKSILCNTIGKLHFVVSSKIIEKVKILKLHSNKVCNSQQRKQQTIKSNLRTSIVKYI